MRNHFSDFAITLFVFGLTLTVNRVFCSDALAQGFNVTIGSATVDLTPNTPIETASIDFSLENPTANALPISGFIFFLEIDPVDGALPAGVTFDTPAVTFSSGNGEGLLPAANSDGLINMTPDFGDIGFGQFQFTAASLPAGASENLLTVNLLIDPETAVAGEYTVTLLTGDDQSNITPKDDEGQELTSTTGTLTLADADPILLGDVNVDGQVNFLDISPFISLLSDSGMQAEADTNQDGMVTFLDIAPFIIILSNP